MSTQPSNYKGTYAIHPGVDYARWRACEGGNNEWCRTPIVSICDGVVVRGRNPNDGYGGSASPGFGISIRCFDTSKGSSDPNEPINLLDYDTDGDGNPNLSNIVVSYNHLGFCTQWTKNEAGAWECTGDRLDTRFDDYYIALSGELGGVASGDGVVVRRNQYLGTTGYHPTFDHLHMEIHLARGYETGRSAIVLNPFLTYSSYLWGLHGVQGHLVRAYYPVVLDWNNRDAETNVQESPEAIGPYGIFLGDLDRWSQGGNRARGDRNNGNQRFWSIQTPVPTTVVEWYQDLYPIPLRGVMNDTYSMDLMSVLLALYPPGSDYATQYFNEFGVTPNCTVVPNVTPLRLQCPRNDVLQELPE
jgi:hypothetical protein